MRTYEKVLLVPILAGLLALAFLVPAATRATQPPKHVPAALEGVSRTQGLTGDASPYLLCQPEGSLSRVVDGRTLVAVAADESGHLALYGGAGEGGEGGEAGGRTTEDSYEILKGCLPQLAFTNYASVLVDGRPPEAAAPQNVRARTTRADDGSLRTSFSFRGGLGLEQRLYLEGPRLRVVYELSNTSSEDTSVSLRSLLTPAPAAGESGAAPRFFVGSGGDARPVLYESEVAGDRVAAVSAPRRGAASDSSGRLSFPGTRDPDVLAFASTLDLAAAQFRYTPPKDGGWPLPPSSSIGAYWLYEDLPRGETATFSYTYEVPVPGTGG